MKSARRSGSASSATSSNSEVKGHWVADVSSNECTACGVKFGLLVRRHHCRQCGNLFCSRCTSKEKPLQSMGLGDRPQRVCDECFAIDTGGAGLAGLDLAGLGLDDSVHEDEDAGDDVAVEGAIDVNNGAEDEDTDVDEDDPELLAELQVHKHSWGNARYCRMHTHSMLWLQGIGWQDDEDAAVSNKLPRMTPEALEKLRRQAQAERLRAVALSRAGKTTEARDALRAAKQLQEQVLAAEAAVEAAAKKKQSSVLRARSSGLDIAGPFDLTEEDMDDPEALAELRELGWVDEDDEEGVVLGCTSASEGELFDESNTEDEDDINDTGFDGIGTSSFPLPRVQAPGPAVATDAALLGLSPDALHSGLTDEVDEDTQASVKVPIPFSSSASHSEAVGIPVRTAVATDAALLGVSPDAIHSGLDVVSAEQQQQQQIQPPTRPQHVEISSTTAAAARTAVATDAALLGVSPDAIHTGLEPLAIAARKPHVQTSVANKQEVPGRQPVAPALNPAKLQAAIKAAKLQALHFKKAGNMVEAKAALRRARALEQQLAG